MDWMFESRDKSLANNAKRVVEDMHRHLDREKRRNKELEKIVLRFQHLCTDSLEQDLRRLDVRKLELQSELETIERHIHEKRTILERTKEEVRDILANSSTNHESVDTSSHEIESDHLESDMLVKVKSVSQSSSPSSASDTPRKSGFNSSTDITSLISTTIMSPSLSNHSPRQEKESALEQQYMEEEEILDTCREVVHNFLFLIHQNNSTDLIAYSITNNLRKLEFVDVCKVINIEKQPNTTLLSKQEIPLFDCKIIPNHDRDFPDTRDLEVPHHLIVNKAKASRSIILFGQLVGAIEVPTVPEVLIDVWRYTPNAYLNGPNPPTNQSSEERLWASTVIDDVNFAVLERIFITTNIQWGVSTVVQIDLFGRHPKTGKILVESIVPA